MVQEHTEALALLRCIRNMLVGIGFMVLALGLFVFGYCLLQDSNGSLYLFWVCAIIFVLSAGYWWESRRPADPGKDLRDRKR